MRPRHLPWVGIGLLAGWLLGRLPEIAADIAAVRSVALSSLRIAARAATGAQTPAVRPPPPHVDSSVALPHAVRLVRSVALTVPGVARPAQRIAEAAVVAVPVLLAAAEPSPEATPAPGSQTAFTLAEAGYAALSAGDRRAAARLLRAALDSGAEPAQAAQWRADLRGLTKRVFVSSNGVARRPLGQADVLAGQRALTGPQAGLTLGVRLDPLARRPVDATARLTVAPASAGVPGGQRQAALGLAWRPLGGDALVLAAERLVAVGSSGRNDWLARAAGGIGRGYGPTAGAPRRWLHASLYGEANLIGVRRPDVQAGAEAHGGLGLALAPGLTATPNLGVWGAYQDDGRRLTRLELGPELWLRWMPGALAVDVRAGYRWPIAGNADGAAGPAVVLGVSY